MTDEIGKPIEIIDRLPVSEWKGFRDLRLRALQNEPQAFLLTYEEALKRPPEKWQSTLQKVIDWESWLVFAKTDKSLIGMIGAFQYEEDKKKNAATIYGVYVENKMRGKGIGNKLMNRLLEQLKENGILKAHLTVNEEQISAVRFYQKFGFKLVGEENLELGDGKMHKELVMEKE